MARALLPQVLAAAVLSLIVARPAAAGGRCPGGRSARVHVVQKGETLSAIASAAELRVADLLASNEDLNPDALSEGQKLHICPKREPRRGPRCGRDRRIYGHSVKRGESLPKIAARYATTEADLLKRNASLKGDPTNLRAGQQLDVCTQPMRYRASRLCDYRTPVFEHIVIEGEWLAEIASRYGVRQRELLRLNARLRNNPDRLRSGQKLRVCPDIAPRVREKLEHGVRKGDNLASIASKYDLNPRQLLSFQRGRLDNPDRLRIGQRLVVWRDGGIAPGFAEEDEDENAQLVGGIQLPQSPDYAIKNPNTAWGTGQTVRLLQGAIKSYRRRAKKPSKVVVGDLSRKGGGKFPPHKSHRSGQDVDVGYVLADDGDGRTRFERATKKNLDLQRTWQLLSAFLDTGRVRYVFIDYNLQALLYDYAKSHGTRESELDELFQYPRSRHRAYGIIRDDRGHDDHFHVRFQ
ncbi:MAG: penicillin-insensitive murein endopeptidase [Myxococcales bacterium]|nr:penicillin-insensitive murein endopeptidase [Myxococcales bacterium]